MTEPELLQEWDYRYQERIGNLCGKGEPDAVQRKLASDPFKEPYVEPEIVALKDGYVSWRTR